MTPLQVLAAGFCLVVLASTAGAARDSSALTATPLTNPQPLPLGTVTAEGTLVETQEAVSAPVQADSDALGETLANVMQTALTSAADTAEPAILQAVQGGSDAVTINAPRVQAGLQSAAATASSQLPTSAAAATGLAGIAPAFGTEVGPALAANAPGLGALAAGALRGLVNIAAAATPSVGPALRTTAATAAGGIRAAAPSIAPAASRVGPTLGGFLGSALTNAVLPAARQLPSVVSGVTPLLTRMLPAGVSFVTNQETHDMHVDGVAEPAEALGEPHDVHVDGEELPHDVHIDTDAPTPAAAEPVVDDGADAPVTAPSGVGAPELAPLLALRQSDTM